MEDLGRLALKNKILLEDLNYINKNLTEYEKKKFANKTILITGCAGFLGFYFMLFLLYFAKELNIRALIGLDNFRLGRPKWVQDLIDKYNGKLELLTFDIGKDDLTGIAKADKADFIIHMASIASPSFYRKYPIETIDANVWGLRRLLELYKGKNISGLLFFSSSEIYGDPFPEFIPTPETYRGNVETLGPRACYDESKRFGETLCYVYANQYNMPIGIARPFNNYGPGMKLDDRRVPADFAKAVCENKDIVMYSDGTPKRTFCYIADAIVGYLKILLYGKFDFFNIGIDKPEISINDLAEIYSRKGREIMGFTGSIKFTQHHEKDYLTHNPSRRCPVIKKARELLGYNPAIEVEEGVGRFIEFLKINGKEL